MKKRYEAAKIENGCNLGVWVNRVSQEGILETHSIGSKDGAGNVRDSGCFAERMPYLLYRYTPFFHIHNCL